MLWYLLYPLRGTTQPPRLSANHPIRRALYRHGKTTAEHWLVAMLVTVAIAMAFSYPTILLAENPTTGLASYPHHVWTTARPIDEHPHDADIEMRQVWIHGSYMRALEKDVLHSALDIQQTLIGSDSWTSVFPLLRSSPLSWGYHSPLMYWNNSRLIIDQDDDILRTINRQAGTTSSSLNVALRPASVFAGKKFEHRKLIAADALVITLINKVEDGVGNQWRDRMSTLTTGACKDCTLFPKDAHVTRSRIYEFSFTPLSVHENVALTFAYSLMALYVLLSLRRIKAFHSRFGLVVTAITQMTCSILASFTICGILKINLSMIPQNAYPFVVLVIGLENMFRIINAVVAYPPTMATELRIANALGDVGPVSLATVAQNLILLSLLGRVVSPGVAAFCAFACIATLFDAFFLLTFFVAVLMVDIRRFELQDALARANQSKPKRKPSPIPHNTWFDALVRGRLPFSTRMAGTAVTTTFILSLNYHFFEHKESATSLRHLLQLVKNGPPSLTDFDTFAPLPINATMTPGQWMRMQDFDTAKEVMRLAKPGADSFTIRIWAPLIVVLAGADRTGIENQEWTTALRSFAIHHFYPVATAVVFAVAFVAVLMNFLLYTEHEDEQHRSLEEEEAEALSVTTVALPHKLDIIKLSGNGNGHFVSVGLDRSIAVSRYDRANRSCRIYQLSGGVLAQIFWPVHQITLDDSGERIAIRCGDDRVLVYSLTTSSLCGDHLLYPEADEDSEVLFDFVRLTCKSSVTTYVIVLTSGGHLRMLNVDNGKALAKRLTSAPILGARIVSPTAKESRLLVVTDEGLLIAFIWDGNDWSEVGNHQLSSGPGHGGISGNVRIQHHSEMGCEILLLTTTKQVVTVDGQTFVQLCSVNLDDSDPLIDHLILGESLKCPSCGLLAFRSAAVIADAPTDQECIITSLLPRDADNGAICAVNRTLKCTSFDVAQKTTHRLSEPGAWSVVSSQAILGLRKLPRPDEEAHRSRGHLSAAQLRQRRTMRFKAGPEYEEKWEGYLFTADGDIETIPVPSDADDPQLGTALYVTSAGPAVPLDGQSIAVAFGNTIKILQSRKKGCVARRPTGRTLLRPAASANAQRYLRKIR